LPVERKTLRPSASRYRQYQAPLGEARVTVNTGHSIAYPIAENFFPEVSRIH
jgi:hypothetical protein